MNFFSKLFNNNNSNRKNSDLDNNIYELLIENESDNLDIEKPRSLFNVFKKEYNQESVFPFKKIKIKCLKESLPALADGHTTIKTPIPVEVAPKKLKVIVGKNRMF